MSLPAEHPEASTDEDVLRATLGGPFVDWILNTRADVLTDGQEAVRAVLTEAVRRHSAEHPDWPAAGALAGLARFDDGPSGLQQLRVRAGGELPVHPAASGDDFLDALVATADDIYPEMLLLVRHPHLSFEGVLTCPAARRAADLAQAEPMVSLPERDHPATNSLRVLRSTGLTDARSDVVGAGQAVRQTGATPEPSKGCRPSSWR